MDSNPDITVRMRMKKRNSPCRRRNARRALEYRTKKVGIDACTQTEPDTDAEIKPLADVDSTFKENQDFTGNNPELFKEVTPKEETPEPAPEKPNTMKSRFLNLHRGKNKHKKDKKSKTNNLSSEPSAEKELGGDIKDNSTATAEEEPEEPDEPAGQILSDSSTLGTRHPLNIMYDNLEDIMRFSRLAERGNMIMALRHIVRNLHTHGAQINFSQPEAGDRLELKSLNLPSDPTKLNDLVIKVFRRRDEKVDLQRLYEDFVKSHGRVVYDKKRNGHIAMCSLTVRERIKYTRIGQLNAQRSATVLIVCRKLTEELDIDILCLQEPYSRFGSIPHMPHQAQVICGENQLMAAIIILNKEYKVVKISQFCDTHNVCAEVTTRFGTYILFNSYCQFSLDLDLNKFREVCETFSDTSVILMADINSKSTWWYSNFTDARGEQVEELISEQGLNVENLPFNPPTFENRAGAKSNIDITLTNEKAQYAVRDWRVGQGLTTSDHNLIYFKISFDNHVANYNIETKFNYSRANWEKLKQNLMIPTPICLGDDLDRKVEELAIALRAAMKHSVPRIRAQVRDVYRPWSDALQSLRGRVRRAWRVSAEQSARNQAKKLA